MIMEMCVNSDITIEEKRAYCEMEVTLNGERAKISGVYLDFPVVWKLDCPEFGCEFSWHAVKRIIKKAKGRFKS